jgi:hypothetical protein
MSTVQTSIHCPPALRSQWCNEPAVQPCSTRPSPASGAPSPANSRSRLTSTARACGRTFSGRPDRPFELTFEVYGAAGLRQRFGAPPSAGVTTRCRSAIRPRRTPVGVTAGLEGFIPLPPRFESVLSRPVLTPSRRAAWEGRLLSAALDLPVWPAPGAAGGRGVVRLVGAAAVRHPDGRAFRSWNGAHDHRTVAATG